MVLYQQRLIFNNMFHEFIDKRKDWPIYDNAFAGNFKNIIKK